MKIHILALLSTLDCETTTDIIGAYHCVFKAEKDGNELLRVSEADSSLYSYEILILETEVK